MGAGTRVLARGRRRRLSVGAEASLGEPRFADLCVAAGPVDASGQTPISCLVLVLTRSEAQEVGTAGAGGKDGKG
jgi:hypothetical protein